MVDFFQYSLESAICLAVLLLPYLLWFRKNTFHQLNRFYLLGALLFSLSAPLVNIEIAMEIAPMPKLTKDLSLFEEVPQLKEQVPMEESLPSDEITAYKQPSGEKATAIEKGGIWSLSEILTAIYFLGFSLFAGMFLYRLSRLFLLIRRGAKTRHAVFTIVQLSGKQVFSFFRYVFVDAARYGEQELKTLLSHEQVHIKQWHSMDVLMLEILQVIFWFDPLYRIYRKLLQQEHEYFVDAATSKEIGQPQYAQMLLTLATSKQPVLGHAFAYIPIKHRIFKLFQKPSTTMERSRFFISLPIVLSLFFVFSCSFDELDESPIEKVVTSEQVRRVKAIFKNEKTVTKNEVSFAEFNFDENGSLIKRPHTGEYEFFTLLDKGLPHFATYFIHPLFRSYPNHSDVLSKDFYPKNIQHLAIKDPVFKQIEILLYHNKMQKFIDLDINFLRDISEYQMVNINEVSGNVGSYTVERQEEFGNNKVDVEIVYGENGLPTYWRKTREYVPLSTEKIPMTFYENMPEKELKEQLEKQLANTPSSMGYSFEIAYNAEDLLSKIIYFPRAMANGNETEMRLYYNGAQQIHEMGMYNAEGIFLRKYRFHYNEAGYCIKKELINREGSVEFLVRFEYDYFNN